jgi:polyisoprenoid-binding protein YceI
VRYRVTAGTLTVQARSKIHDTRTVWNRISGDVTADPETLAEVGPGATSAVFEVDMTAYDAGDFLKNRKLRKDFDLDAHPKARFTLRELRGVVRTGATFTATAVGELAWRGKQIELTLAGRGTLDDMRLEASATFELDIRRLGLQAPRFLIFKVEDEVTVEVAIRGTVAA